MDESRPIFNPENFRKFRVTYTPAPRSVVLWRRNEGEAMLQVVESLKFWDQEWSDMRAEEVEDAREGLFEEAKAEEATP